MKKISIAALLLISFGLSACNTLQGVGKDVQKVGEKIEDASKKK
jgi:predicted small secreted protein